MRPRGRHRRRLRQRRASRASPGRGHRDYTARVRVAGRPPRARRGVPLPLRHGRGGLSRSGASGPRGPPTRASRSGSRSSPARSSSPASTRAHADLAAQQDVDLVVCLGDYIYEQAFATDVAQRARPRGPTRPPTARPRRSTSTAASTRSTTPTSDLLEVRRQFPLMAIWDDHEVEDNYAARQARRRREQPPRAVRRAPRERLSRVRTSTCRASARATAASTGASQLGGAEVFLLDTRQLPRRPALQSERRVHLHPCPPTDTDAPGRTLLGATQKAWLKDALASSQARWKLIGNQVMITSLDAPPRNPINTDSWDGYGAERRELIDHIGRQNGSRTSRSSPATSTPTSPAT